MVAVRSAQRLIDDRAESLVEVTLRVPDEFRLQLVFRQVRRDRFEAGLPEDCNFQFCEGVRQYAPWFGEIRRISGVREAVKGFLRSVPETEHFIACRKMVGSCTLPGLPFRSASTMRLKPLAAVIGPTGPIPRFAGVELQPRQCNWR